MSRPTLFQVLIEPMARRRALQYARRRLGLHGRTSYSQCGEDLILRFVFDSIGIATPSYLDIGANDPVRFSNSYMFYRQGAAGVCVEPDPRLAARLRRKRPRDKVLETGVAASPGVLQFFVMSEPVLNTFSRAEAERLVAMGHRIETTLEVRVVTVEEAFEQCGGTPDILNLDVEGMDAEIVAAIDFSRHRPIACCIETLTYSETGGGEKIRSIFEMMSAQGYFPYADTHVNTVFVDVKRWRGRGR